MNGIRLLMAITRREFEEDYITFLKRNHISAIFSTPARGTAGQTILRMLGLDKSEKSIILAFAEKSHAKQLMNGMISRLGINVAGNGIAISIPVGSIGGASAMKYLMEGQDVIIGEVNEVEQKQEYHYELLAAIAESGTADMVMTAARKANAGGGTVIHAKGTGTDFTSKFFGVSIATEKDIVLIVVKKEDKANVMRSIMSEAGIRSEAHTALISLPVEDVVGLTSVMIDDNKAE